MPPVLPFDIWAYIASYLSIVELQLLFSVNRALYDISMNIRYKTLRLRYLNKLTVSKLQMMSETVSVANRVQYLEFYGMILEDLWMSRSSRLWRLKTQCRHLIGLFSKDSTALTTKSITSVNKILLNAVKNMHGLKSVSFDLHSSNRFVEPYLPLVGQIWSTISGRVDSLCIRVHARDAHLLRPTFRSINGVEHLSVSLQGIYQGIYPGEVPGLVDLINTTSKSLESLQLEISFSSNSSLALNMFTNLHTLPRLKYVDLSISNTIGPCVSTLLNAHGESIKELKLSFRRSDGHEPLDISPLRLPSLRKLSIVWNPFDWGSRSNNPFLDLWTRVDFPMLDCLEVINPLTDGDDITLFCKTFKRSSIHCVRRLQLPCRNLTAETFDHLSKAFPNLHTLIIPTIFLSKLDSYAPAWDIDTFAADMAPREYLAWTLEDLKITPASGSLGALVSLGRRLSYQVMWIAASHIPSVRSFCGSGHMNILEELDEHLTSLGPESLSHTSG